MKAWISRMLSDAKGLPDEARVALILLTLAYVGFWAWNMADGRPFDAVSFGTGAGLLMAAFGGALWARKDN